MSQRANLNGIKIAYEVEGEGPPLLLIMGLGYARWGWTWIRPELEKRFLTIVFDNRCTGESSCSEEPFTMAEMADDAAGLLDHLGMRSAHVFGISMGGFIAQELAINHPDRVRSLVLGCTHLGIGNMVPLSEESLKQLSDRSGTPEEQIRRGMPYSFRPGWVTEHTEEFDEIVKLRMPHQPPVEWYMRQYQATLTHDTSLRAKTIAAPTLVLQGTADRLVPPENAALVAGAIPDARLEMLEGAGHLFFIEEPARVARLIEEFCFHLSD